MIISDLYMQYLRGELFSTGAKLPLYTAEDVESIDRLQLLGDHCRGKRVLHVGCCDHIDVIERKRKLGVYLHDILTQRTQEVIGIDINQESLNFLKKNGVENVINLDVTKSIAEQGYSYLLSTHWDIMILGEVVEHIGNPVAFLSAIHHRFKDVVDELIVTVPNALNQRGGGHKKAQEVINTDHRFWFTPFTISKILVDASFIPTEIKFVWGFPNSIRKPRFNFIKRLLELKFWKYPSMRDGLLVHALFKKK